MCVGDDKPFIFRDVDLLVYFVAYNAVAALHHDTRINFILQYPCNRTGRPQTIVFVRIRVVVLEALFLFIGFGVRLSHLIKPFGNPHFAVTLIDKPMINAFDNLRCFFIYKQAVFVVRVFLVAIRGKSADELAALPFHLECFADFFGSGSGKLFIKHSPYRHFKTACRMGVSIGINEWCACANKPCSVNGNELFKKLLLIGKVAETACKGLDNHAVYFFSGNAALKPFEVRPRCVGACQSVVGKHVHNHISTRLKIAVYKVAEYFFLIDNTFAFVLVVVLSG